MRSVGALAPAGQRLVAVQTNRGRTRLCLVGGDRPGPCKSLPFAATGVAVAGPTIYVSDGAGGRVVPYRLRKKTLTARSPIRSRSALSFSYPSRVMGMRSSDMVAILRAKSATALGNAKSAAGTKRRLRRQMQPNIKRRGYKPLFSEGSGGL